ncbi:MAG: hypothetical protein ACLTNK_00560 [Akkermansia muciniphila]
MVVTACPARNRTAGLHKPCGPWGISRAYAAIAAFQLVEQGVWKSRTRYPFCQGPSGIWKRLVLRLATPQFRIGKSPYDAARDYDPAELLSWSGWGPDPPEREDATNFLLSMVVDAVAGMP